MDYWICKDCRLSDVCIMAAPDGNWKACDDIVLKEELMDDYNEKTTPRKKHWYIRVPFTNKRLIFEGLSYVGWYVFK